MSGKTAIPAALLFLTVCFLYGEDFGLTGAETEWLSEHPVIRVGVGTSFPPIQYVTEVEGGWKFNGIASDYLDVLSGLLGVDFEPVFGITFSEAMEMGRRKEIDMFPCVAYSEERDSFLDFTEGYLENPIVIFANEDAPFIGSIQDLAGLRVADVEALYLYKKLRQDVPDINFVLTENSEDALRKVAFGQADANVSGLISGSYMIRKNHWTNIKVASPTPYPDTVFRMAVRDDWPELTAILDKALESVDYSRKNQIMQKWIAVRYEYGINQREVLTRLLLVIGLAALIVGVVLLWVFRLRKEIRQRKAAEQHLSASEKQLREMVREKELLIKEMNHRVKNNLSLVSSLLNMQLSELIDQNDVEKIHDIIRRIDSMVLLHEKLSMSADLKNIEIDEYLGELINGIGKTLTGSQKNISIEHDAVGISLDARIIAPLGLIITELVTNAVKYGEPRTIKITIGRGSGSDLVLEVRNDGLPIPDEIELDRPTSLGLTLVTGLVRQLKGEIEMVKAPTPRFRIKISTK